MIDVADSPMAKMRMSAWAACRLVEEQLGVETVLHFPTRGRNLLRLQGDLLGAHALGIRNLFVCVGDPVTIGDYPQGSGNVDVTATGLLALIADEFNRGHDRAGSSIGEPTSFFAGAAVAPNAPDLERECRLLKKKVDAGARFLLSQPLYEPDGLAPAARDLRACGRRPAARAGPRRRPAAGHRPARRVPAQRGARHRGPAPPPGPGWNAPATTPPGGAWSWPPSSAAGLREAGAAGVYVMPQFGRYDLAAEVVEAARTP